MLNFNKWFTQENSKIEFQVKAMFRFNLVFCRAEVDVFWIDKPLKKKCKDGEPNKSLDSKSNSKK